MDILNYLVISWHILTSSWDIYEHTYTYIYMYVFYIYIYIYIHWIDSFTDSHGFKIPRLNRLPRRVERNGFLGFLPKLCLQPGWVQDALAPVDGSSWKTCWTWIYDTQWCIWNIWHINDVYDIYDVYMTYMESSWMNLDDLFMVYWCPKWPKSMVTNRPRDGRLALTARAGDEWILLVWRVPQ